MRRTSLWATGFVLGSAGLLGCSRSEAPRGAPSTELPGFAAARPVTESDPPRVTSYDLHASLDPSTHEIHGDGTIHFTNTSQAPLSVLWFHQYLNAFKNGRSVFLQEKTGGFRGQATDITWGFVEVTRLALGDTDLLARRVPKDPAAPPDADETELAVELPEALAVGASISLQVAWTSRLPSVVLRTGFHDSFHMAGQWFPKLAKLDATGFTHFPFHHFSEFYADFGDYRVQLEAPDAFVLGATGARESETHENGRRRETYVAKGVHDFAFTAWDQFVERTETIDGVAVRALAPKGHEAVVERELASIRFALPHYGARYGRYPYSTLTLVHPPPGAAEAGGMEYPTFITTGGDPRTPAFARSIEAVTVHEFGHQYFYGLLASNEHQAPFLDEGLNSFAEIDALERWLGPKTAAASLGAFSLGIADVHGLTGRRNVHDTTVDTEAAEFPTGGAYGAQVYSRTAALLETLRRSYGDAAFFQTFGSYTREFRFRHPTEPDLLAAIGTGLGEPARTFLQAGLSTGATIDVAVLEASSGQRREPGGLFGSPPQAREAKTGSDWVSTFVVSRRGELTLPVEIELRFRDGSRRRRTWDPAQSHTAQLQEESPSALTAVLLDPDRKLLVDDNWENNAFVLDGSATPKQRDSLFVSALAALFAEAL